jgi:hypothetical protein
MARRSGIARVTVLALARVAEGGRVIGVEPNTVGDRLVEILAPTHADRPPVSALKLAPFDRNGGIGGLDLAAVAVAEGLVGPLLPARPSAARRPTHRSD